MTELNTKKNIANQDDFLQKLLAAHEGLSKEESDAFNARLILLMANHIGDMDVIGQALKAAAETGGRRAP
jgi:hypothetical protein